MSSGKLQQELQASKPFPSPAHEAVVGIMRTNELLQIRLTRLFREYGVTAQQYNILRILQGSGKPLPCLEIASRMITVVPAITGLIDRLEKAALVRRVRSETDRRVVNVGITDAGTALLAEAEEPLGTLHESLMGHMEPAELEALTALLDKVRAPHQTQD
jgi:DNA-binding MarR family transcriptional regulator